MCNSKLSSTQLSYIVVKTYIINEYQKTLLCSKQSNLCGGVNPKRPPVLIGAHLDKHWYKSNHISIVKHEIKIVKHFALTV